MIYCRENEHNVSTLKRRQAPMPPLRTITRRFEADKKPELVVTTIKKKIISPAAQTIEIVDGKSVARCLCRHPHVFSIIQAEL